MKNEETFNKWFSVFILLGMTLALVITTALSLGSAETGKVLLLISAFGSLMGVLATVFSANGNVFTFLFGFMDVSIYGVMCFISWKNGGAGLGNAVLNLLYFVPMQFVGYWQWRKRGAAADTQVVARRLSRKQWSWVSAGLVLGSVVGYLVISHFDKSAADSFIKVAVLMDVLSIVCNVIGQMLMSTAYMEQWILWIAVNVFSIIMWVNSISAGGESFAVVFLIKYIFYFINSLNGLRIWIGLSRNNA